MLWWLSAVWLSALWLSGWVQWVVSGHTYLMKGEQSTFETDLCLEEAEPEGICGSFYGRIPRVVSGSRDYFFTLWPPEDGEETEGCFGMHVKSVEQLCSRDSCKGGLEN